MQEFKQHLTVKNILSALVVLITVAGIPLGVNLVRNQQLLKSRASNNNIRFTGPNVKVLNGREVAVDSTIQIAVNAGEPAGPTPTASPLDLKIDITNVSPSTTVNVGDAVIVTFNAGADVNAANLWLGGCQRFDSNGSCNETSGTVVLRATFNGRTGTINWPANFRRTTDVTQIRVYGYRCLGLAAGATPTLSQNCDGGPNNFDARSVTINGAQNVTPSAPIPTRSGSIDISNRNPNINVYWISAIPISQSSDSSNNKISNPTFSTSQDVYFYFNKNDDVTDVNLKVDGVESGSPYQVSFAIDTKCPQQGCFIKWNANSEDAAYKHTDGTHTVVLKAYVCPDSTRNGCKVGTQQSFSITFRSSASNGLISSIGNKLMSILPQGGVITSAYAVLNPACGTDQNVAKVQCNACSNGINAVQYNANNCALADVHDDRCNCSPTSAPVATTPSVAPTAAPTAGSLPACGISTYSITQTGGRKCYAAPNGVIQSALPTGCTLPSDVTACPDLVNPTVAPTAGSGAPTSPTVAAGGGAALSATPTITISSGNTITLPAGVTVKKYKITDIAAGSDRNDNIWNSISEHDYTTGGTNQTDFTFTPMACNTASCDQYPREERLVYVLFIGTNPDNTQYKAVASAKILLALKPKITSISCQSSPTGIGTLITINGQHFGISAGTVSYNSQNTQDSTTTWSNGQIITTSSLPLDTTKDIIVTTPEGPDNSVTAKCGDPTKYALDFSASLTCRTVDKPLREASVEIRDLSSLGVGSTASTRNAPVIYKNAKEPFDEQGRPTGLSGLEKIEEGRTYELIIKAVGTLQKVVKFVAIRGTNVLDPIQLPLGDISPLNKPDNQINALDRSELNQEWSAAKDVAKPADFNLDSRVNSFDNRCLNSNYGQSGDNP